MFCKQQLFRRIFEKHIPLDFFKPWVIALLAASLFVLIVVIYIVVMKTCCKKSDLDDEETIEDI